MHTVTTVAALREQVAVWREAGERIAFVPTMGNLHAGHLKLVARAHALADRVVASIFVNPLQFGPGEDYESYPRTLAEDEKKLARLRVDLVFAPPVEEMYPNGAGETTTIRVPRELTDQLCGASRPGHFEGMSSVVARLFNMVQPDVAVFGEKDYQQLTVIRRMVRDLAMPVEIEGVPTEREPDGLAMSSRNQYLGAAEREKAPALYAALSRAAARLAAGETDFARLARDGFADLEAAGFQPEYFEIREAETLHPPRTDSPAWAVLAAARLGRARLIDNVEVSSPA